MARSIETESRLGYFATLYRKVTRQVKEGIAQGFFDDGPRMERLDVTFADRYLGALDEIVRFRARESNDVAKVIRVLSQVPGPRLAEVETRVQARKQTAAAVSAPC